MPDAPVPHVTDLQIKEDTDELMKECLLRAQTWCRDLDLTPFTSADIAYIAMTRWMYLKEKLFNHSIKYYREGGKK